MEDILYQADTDPDPDLQKSGPWTFRKTDHIPKFTL